MALWNRPRPPRVLLVEDDYDIANMLRIHLVSAHEAEVDVAQRGDDALALCQRHHYDAIVLDIMLPDIDGYHVFRSLRRSGNQTPVVFLTQRDERSSELTGLEMGAVDYITKPFDLRVFVLRLRNVLRFGHLQFFSTWPDDQLTKPEGLGHLPGSRDEAYIIEAIRHLLLDAFGPEELRRLCADHQEFRELLRDFGPNDSLNQLVDKLVFYCHHRLLFGELLSHVKAENPRQYERFEAQLRLRAERG